MPQCVRVVFQQPPNPPFDSIRGQSNPDCDACCGEYDGFTIKSGTKNVWIDHVTFERTGDEHISVVENDGTMNGSGASKDVAISWTRHKQQNQVFGVGNMDDNLSNIAKYRRVTAHHNYYGGTAIRHPKMQSGRVHLYNNYYVNWTHWGVCANYGSHLRAEANIWDNTTSALEGIRYGCDGVSGKGNGKVSGDAPVIVER